MIRRNLSYVLDVEPVFLWQHSTNHLWTTWCGGGYIQSFGFKSAVRITLWFYSCLCWTNCDWGNLLVADMRTTATLRQNWKGGLHQKWTKKQQQKSGEWSAWPLRPQFSCVASEKCFWTQCISVERIDKVNVEEEVKEVGTKGAVLSYVFS